MKRIALLLALTVAGCGAPSAPTAPPTPPPPAYPSMIGGWSGTFADTAIPNTGSYVCTMTWLVGSQTAGAFSGTFQATPGNSNACGIAGAVQGTITTDSKLEVRLTTSAPRTCNYEYGDGIYRGVLSSSGAVTLQTLFGQTCGRTSYQMTSVITVSRR